MTIPFSKQKMQKKKCERHRFLTPQPEAARLYACENLNVRQLIPKQFRSLLQFELENWPAPKVFKRLQTPSGSRGGPNFSPPGHLP